MRLCHVPVPNNQILLVELLYRLGVTVCLSHWEGPPSWQIPGVRPLMLELPSQLCSSAESVRSLAAECFRKKLCLREDVFSPAVACMHAHILLQHSTSSPLSLGCSGAAVLGRLHHDHLPPPAGFQLSIATAAVGGKWGSSSCRRYRWRAAVRPRPALRAPRERFEFSVQIGSCGRRARERALPRAPSCVSRP